MGVHLDLWKQVLVLGVAEAGLYALLPIALVMSYRVSRTIAFVHGGIAASAALLYWWFVFDNPAVPGFRPTVPPFVGLMIMVAFGALCGWLYGYGMTLPKIASLPRMTLTVVSLGAMMLSIGFFSGPPLNIPAESIPPSPFAKHNVEIFGVTVTSLRWATMLLAVGLIAGLAVFLNKSRTGRYLRAISDDLEASAWCGVRVAKIGTGVHAGAGAVAALGGALIAAYSGPDPENLIIFLLRGLTVSIVGGLMSLPLALLASLVTGIVETALVVGVVGPGPLGSAYGIGKRELILNLILLLVVLGVSRVRPQQFYLLERQSL